MGTTNLLIVTGHILAWQDIQAYEPETDNLEKHNIRTEDGEFKNNILSLLASSTALNAIYQVNGDELKYRPEISEELKIEIRTYFDKNYRPKLHIRKIIKRDKRGHFFG